MDLVEEVQPEELSEFTMPTAPISQRSSIDRNRNSMHREGKESKKFKDQVSIESLTLR